jgi:adenylosuccinate synthase
MPLDIIVGAQWGDEGKGRIVDLIAEQADVVARFGGGDNAGHTVQAGGRLFKLHLIPAGILYPEVLCILASGMVVNPSSLVSEMDELLAAGISITPERLKLSHNAHIITPIHRMLDAAEEAARTGKGLGTTRRGIGPAYADKAARHGIRAGAMGNPDAFAESLRQHMLAGGKLLESVHGLAAPAIDPAVETYLQLARRLEPYLADTGRLISERLESGQNVLAEGAQGTLLDLDHGTYPYVTSSHPTSAGALLGLGLGPTHIRRIIGVVKAFQTRVGEGPFPTEVTGPTAERLRGSGSQPWDEFGATTGRPRRIGWLDGVLLRYAARINGLTELALTKLDVLTGLDPLQLCTGYQVHDGSSHDFPDRMEDLGRVDPRYTSFPGWRERLEQTRTWQELPAPAQAYVHAIQAFARLPIRTLSVGPERHQVIKLEAPI